MTDRTPPAIAILLDEHAIGRRYLDALTDLPAGPLSADEARSALEAVGAALAYFDDELEEHIEKEERPLFPLLRAKVDNVRLIDEMVAEHDQIRIQRDQLRDALDDLLAGHHDLRAEREALRAAVEALNTDRDPAAATGLVRGARRIADTALLHFDNEEELVFPLAPLLLSEEDLTAAAAEMGRIAERYRAARAAGTSRS